MKPPLPSKISSCAPVHYILLNTFRKMHLKYESYSLRRILFKTLEQNQGSKSLIEKVFDGNTFKMKAASPV